MALLFIATLCLVIYIVWSFEERTMHSFYPFRPWSCIYSTTDPLQLLSSTVLLIEQKKIQLHSEG